MGDPSTTLLQESTGSLPKPPAPAVLPLPTSPLEEAPTWPSTTLLTPPLLLVFTGSSLPETTEATPATTPLRLLLTLSPLLLPTSTMPSHHSLPRALAPTSSPPGLVSSPLSNLTTPPTPPTLEPPWLLLTLPASPPCSLLSLLPWHQCKCATTSKHSRLPTRSPATSPLALAPLLTCCCSTTRNKQPHFLPTR